jgi:hypothetical protein
MMLLNEYRYWDEYNFHDECDEDGLYDDGLLVPADHAFVLYTLSCGAMLTAAVGFLTGNKYLAWGTFFGSIVAQKYWSEPRYSWIRSLDIACVLSLMVTHWWAAWVSPIAPLFYTLQTLGAALYGLSWHFALKRNVVAATLAHAAVHVLANTSLVLLYLTLGG